MTSPCWGDKQSIGLKLTAEDMHYKYEPRYKGFASQR